MGSVLKANQVQFADPLALSVNPTPMQQGSKPQRSSVPQRARIVEKTSDYAIIEITCACGRTTQVRCDYAAPEVSATKDTSPNRAHEAK